MKAFATTLIITPESRSLDATTTAPNSSTSVQFIVKVDNGIIFKIHIRCPTKDEQTYFAIDYNENYKIDTICLMTTLIKHKKVDSSM